MLDGLRQKTVAHHFLPQQIQHSSLQLTTSDPFVGPVIANLIML